MFKIFDYKLWLIIGLVFLVIHLYQEISSIKSSIKNLEKNKSIGNISNGNIPSNLELLPLPQQPRNSPPEMIDLNQIGKVNLKTKDDDNYQSESDIQIYSNDAFSTDISVGITDNLNELKKFIDTKAFDQTLNQEEENDGKDDLDEETDDEAGDDKEETDNETDDDKEDDDTRVINLSDDNSITSNLLDDSDEIKKLSFDELKKMKKEDLTELAIKLNVGLFRKREDGKLKSKTKKELISDLMIEK